MFGFGLAEIEYLEYIIKSGFITANPSKLAAVKN